MVNTVPPLHPVLPAIVEAYVNSILVTSNKAIEHTNKPITGDEIKRAFQGNAFEPGAKKREQLSAEFPEGKLKPSLTSKLLLLYYLLLNEDVRLTNMHSFVSQGRKVKCYTTEFLSDLLIKYLLQQVQRDQMSYAGLFSPLLRLLATHFPHLSLVDDWLDDETINVFTNSTKSQESLVISDAVIREALMNEQNY